MTHVRITESLDGVLRSRISSPAAISTPLHTSSSPGICSHVAGHPERTCPGLRDGGGVHHNGVRDRAGTFECRPEGWTSAGTQGPGKCVVLWSESDNVMWFKPQFVRLPPTPTNDINIILKLIGECTSIHLISDYLLTSAQDCFVQKSIPQSKVSKSFWTHFYHSTVDNQMRAKLDPCIGRCSQHVIE